jgi:general secretion pathway protein A
MDYYRILKLDKEPFSNSPDPAFFYQSRQHLECLQKLELALRLRRGLNVIIGDVGTGKTTLCRQLIRRFSENKEVETYLILDPYFSSSAEFLSSVVKMFKGSKQPNSANEWQLKEIIKQYLFQQGVDRQKTIVLIIDEGQKIPIFCLEVLREFLNYETNEYKLLQIVIFAQKEFEHTIREYSNFSDRINLIHYLKSLNFSDTRQMIKYRLEKSSNQFRTYTFFSPAALLAVYWSTGGYPRKIINLCHRCILTMIIQNRSTVDLLLVRSCIQRVFPNRTQKIRKILPAVAVPAIILAVGFWFLNSGQFKILWPLKLKTSTATLNTATEPALLKANEAPLAESISSTLGAVSTLEDFHEESTESVTATNTADEKEKPIINIKENVAGIAKTGSSYNELLGRVTLSRNETLSGLIKNVYGGFSSKHFKFLILANPHIDDPDLVKVGQTILFPAIPASVKPWPMNIWWINIGDKDSLEEAMQVLRSLPKKSPAVRLIPYWNKHEGTKFALLLKRYFSDEAKAKRQLKKLQVSFSGQAKLFASWDEDTVFFADPFFGRKR